MSRTSNLSFRELTLADNRSVRFDELQSVFDELSGKRTVNKALSADDYLPKWDAAPSFLQNRLHTIKKQIELHNSCERNQTKKSDNQALLLKGLLGA